MKKRFLSLAAAAALVLAAAALFTACSETSDTNSTLPAVQNNGTTLTVTLPANATTGFSWEVSDIDDTITAGEPVYKTTPNPRGMVGTGGRTTITFTAAKAGTGTATLTYCRPWEGGETATVYTLTVTTVQQGSEVVFEGYTLEEAE